MTIRVPCPAPDVLRALYAEHKTAAKVGEALGVSLTTAWRWLTATGVDMKIPPDQRRGGRRLKAQGRPHPEPVTLAQAAALRALHAAEPDLTHAALKERVGLQCSRSYIGKILAGEARKAP